MSRWDYDTVFYRVFCITLLAVAFTFTIILTNVFVDIDGLLSKKDKVKTPKQIPNDMLVRHDASDVMNVNMLSEEKSEDVYDDKEYQDSNDLYRTKRALGPRDHLFHIKDPKVKKILTNRLATLLDKLDEEEAAIESKNNNQDFAFEIREKNKNKSKQIQSENVEKINTPDKNSELLLILEDDVTTPKNEVPEPLEQFKTKKEKKEESKTHNDDTKKKSKEDELLHLAMHNIILQGIIGNVNLDEVYKKVADLVKNFESDHSEFNKEKFKSLIKETQHFEKLKQKIEEDLGYENTKVVQKQVNPENTKRSMAKKENVFENKFVQRTTTIKPKGRNIMIKTIIDITALSNDKTNKESDASSKDTVNGIIKLIYNGKSIKFKKVDENNNITQNTSNMKSTEKPSPEVTVANVAENNNETSRDRSNQSYYKKVVNEYLKRFRKESDSLELESPYSRKRLKRHVKVRFDSNKTTAKPKARRKKDDDELFVEIETHFDSKGTKGEKKKKLIRELIEKIQKAIRSDNDTKKKKHWHVKKRVQNPLGTKTATAFINKLMLPLETLAQRHLDPISKSVPMHDEMPAVQNGVENDHWRQNHMGPGFFDKAINSAEMSTVDADYNKVMRNTGIPQRLQKPLNTEMSDEVFQGSNIFDLGNIKYLMKDIDGSGFSVGYNQYTDEAPDPETMKLFMGIENIINTYHQKYDLENIPDTPQPRSFDNNQNNNPYDVNDDQEYLQTNEPEQHLIERRSIKDALKHDHHSNEYKTIFNSKFFPYHTYQEIYNADKKRISKTEHNKKSKKTKSASTQFFIDENVFEKKLKPAEIFTIANLFERRKRSLNVKKISNIKIKKKMSRYLNTKMMASKSIFMNKKRNKRQIDKIRIVARDNLPKSHQNHNSEEDVFVLSDEKVFADRALVSEVTMPELDPNEKLVEEEHYDIISPEKEEDSYDFVNQPQKVSEDPYESENPYAYEANPFEIHNSEFSRRARHNSLMSKYPHIIMDEMSKSKENTYPENLYTYPNNQNIETSTNSAITTIEGLPSANLQEIAKLIAPSDGKYKVTVKIRPKNATSASGFKEVHTSINKSYNKNGLLYTSLVNVSELSKVEKVNNNFSRRYYEKSESGQLKRQQELIKNLIQQHKNRINEQLEQLNIEKGKLETINNENIETAPEKFVDVALPTDPTKILHLNQEEVSKLLTFEESTLKASTQEMPTVFTVPTTTTTTTTTEYVKQRSDIDNIAIITTLERNENVTNEILKKIDQNTGVLKEFLGQIIAKIDMPSRKTDLEKTPLTTKVESNTRKEESPTNHNDEITQAKSPQTVNNHVPFNLENYHQNIPNMLFRNPIRHANNSNSVGIPFVYAYQQPYNMEANKGAPLASVVYHGHIHTSGMNRDSHYKPVEVKRETTSYVNTGILKENESKHSTGENKYNEFWKHKPGEKVLQDFVRQNNSRYFIHEPGNDFKGLSLTDKRVYLPPGLGINNTKV